jgi:hypothetical protein
MSVESKRVFHILAKTWQFDRSQHGSLYDRGMADSYYGRIINPHYGGVGGDSGPMTPVTDEASVAEYRAGYDYNQSMRWFKNGRE